MRVGFRTNFRKHCYHTVVKVFVFEVCVNTFVLHVIMNVMLQKNVQSCETPMYSKYVLIYTNIK
jgi:hypothetical protein